MARNDVYLYTEASDPANAVITSQTVTTAVDFPTLVLGDTPLFNFYFTDGTASWPSWAGNASYAVKWALSDAIAGDETPMALQTSATPITGGWSLRLPLNAGGLISGLSAKRISQDYPVVQLWSHVRVTDPTGYVVSYAMIRTNVRLRAIPDTQATPDDPLPAGTQYVLADQSGALSSPSNFLSVSGLVTTTGTQSITGTKNFTALNGPIGGTTPAAGAFTSLSSSLNSSSAPSLSGALANPTARFIGADATTARAISQGAGSTTPGGFSTVSSRGTLASPTATQSGDAIGYYVSFGYGATGYSSSNRGGMQIVATENWTDNAQGAKVDFYATQNGQISPSAAASLSTSGLSVVGYIAPKLGTTTYASLVSAATAGAGAMIYISDCNSTTRLATAAGGGANKVMVFSDGTNWLIL